MICRDGVHYFIWGSLSTCDGEMPSHLRCQCGATKQGDLNTISGLQAELHRLTIRLTDQEHELISARAELLRWQRMGGSGEE